jgi:hypothetical protein
MKRLFLFLLGKYSNTETERIEILAVLHEKVRDNYTEQTGFGNVYNFFTEFIIANDVIKAYSDNGEDMRMMKRGMSSAFDGAIRYIKPEIRKYKTLFDAIENLNVYAATIQYIYRVDNKFYITTSLCEGELVKIIQPTNLKTKS